VIGHSPGKRPAVSRIPGSPPMGRLPEESASRRHALRRVAARPSAMQCVDTASTGLKASGNGCRATCVGACPGHDKLDGSCRAAGGHLDAQTTLRTGSV